VQLRIKVTLALVVCLGSLLTVGLAAKSRKSWRALPDPFTPYITTGAPPAGDGSGERAIGLRLVWAARGRVQSIGLLFAACLCLAVLEMRTRRRSTGRNDRLATALADALRRGALEFADGGPRIEGPIWGYGSEDDEPDEPNEPKTAQTEANVSRYALLAYRADEKSPLEDAVITISYLGGIDPDAPIRDEQLLLGVPRELIREPRKPDKAVLPRLALTAGRTDRDDPGDSIDEPHFGDRGL
jgi:hypothetical protein